MDNNDDEQKYEPLENKDDDDDERALYLGNNHTALIADDEYDYKYDDTVIELLPILAVTPRYKRYFEHPVYQPYQQRQQQKTQPKNNYIQTFMELDFSMVSKFRFCIILMFVIFMVVGAFLLILLFLHLYPYIPDFSDLDGFIVLIIVCLLGSVIGAIGIYYASSFTDLVQKMEKENKAFQYSNAALKITRIELQQTVADLQVLVKHMSQSGAELNDTLDSFDELRELFQKNRAYENCTFNEYLDHLETQSSDLLHAIRQNEKASVLSILYEIQMRACNDDHGQFGLGSRKRNLNDVVIDQERYQEFLARLCGKTRAKFERFAVEDGVSINMEAFTRQISDVLNYETASEREMRSS